jgi:hypothetical protein
MILELVLIEEPFVSMEIDIGELQEEEVPADNPDRTAREIFQEEVKHQ